MIQMIDQPQAVERKDDVVDKIVARFGADKARLIPILQRIQDEYRYLPKDALSHVARRLGVPLASVYGVATFYAHFALKPKGKYIVRLCDGTACHVKGSIPILDALYKHLGINAENNTTADMLFTVETVSCLGACGLAPAVVINGDVHGLMTPEGTVELVKQIAEREKKQ